MCRMKFNHRALPSKPTHGQQIKPNFIMLSSLTRHVEIMLPSHCAGCKIFADGESPCPISPPNL